MARQISVAAFAITTIIAIFFGILFTPNGIPGIFHWAPNLHPILIGFNPSFAQSKHHIQRLRSLLHTIDLRRQHALVTGSNSGIGYEISKLLYRQGAHLTMVCITEQRCDEAMERIRNEQYDDDGDINYSREATVSSLIMDLSSLQSVQSAATTFLQRNTKLDMMFLNAGIYTAVDKFDSTKQLPLSVDGIEKVFATNVVGHHLLYCTLEPLLLKSNMARVVYTSSFMSYNPSLFFGHHDIFPTDLQSLNAGDSSWVQSVLTYSRSKLALILLTKSMVRRLQEQNVTNVYINAANPGLVRSPMQYDILGPLPSRYYRISKWIQDYQSMWTPMDASLTLLYLGVAIDDIQHKNINGKFYSPVAVEVVSPPEISMNEKIQDEVWNFCDELVKEFIATK